MISSFTLRLPRKAFIATQLVSSCNATHHQTQHMLCKHTSLLLQESVRQTSSSIAASFTIQLRKVTQCAFCNSASNMCAWQIAERWRWPQRRGFYHRPIFSSSAIYPVARNHNWQQQRGISARMTFTWPINSITPSNTSRMASGAIRKLRTWDQPKHAKHKTLEELQGVQQRCSSWATRHF